MSIAYKITISAFPMSKTVTGDPRTTRDMEIEIRRNFILEDDVEDSFKDMFQEMRLRVLHAADSLYLVEKK